MLIPMELAFPILGGFVVAMGATLVELRDSLQPASCPECPHCREVRDEARRREEGDLARLEQRIWDNEREERERRNGRR